MSPDPVHSCILIATIGAKPQLVTLTMDCLRENGDIPGRVLCLHASRRRKETASTLKEIKGDLRITYPETIFNTLELTYNGHPLPDVTTPEQVQAAFRTMYAEVSSIKLTGQTIHLLIAGGRRTLAVFGMAVAQMLFDDQDHLWHLASHPGLETDGRLHASPGEWVRLIPIPFIPWGRLSPAFDVLRSVDDPFIATERLGSLRLREQWDKARIFVLTRLTGAERSVVELLIRDGRSQSEIAEHLTLSPRTVEQHLRSAYRKAADHWELEDVNQARLVRLLNLFYVSGGKD